MKVSFVIPVLNGERFMRRCLDSILAEAAAEDEIIVVDNGSTDATPDIVREFDRASLLECPDVTVSALRNRGANAARHELLAFIDSDCILCEGWRDAVIRVMQDDGIHATGALCEVPEHAGWMEQAWFAQKPHQARLAKYMNTANLVVRADIFARVGGFDEALITDEDCEFGERLNAAGYRILEEPAIRVIHLGNPVTLGAFYRREKWHATSVLESGKTALRNLPTLMSMLFGLALLVGVAAIACAAYVSRDCLWLLLPIPVIPFITAIYRASKFGQYRYILPLTLLWAVFFIARLHNMVLFAFGKHRD